MQYLANAFVLIFAFMSVSISHQSQGAVTVSGTVRDANGSAIENANVELSVANVKTQFTVTDDFGNFRFDKLPSGVYRVRIEHPGLEPVVVRVDATNRTLAPVEVVLSVKRAIRGASDDDTAIRVSAEAASGGTTGLSDQDAATLSQFAFALSSIVQYSKGDAITNASVEIRPRRAKVQSAVSDESGNFSFKEIHPGDYQIRAEHQGFVLTEIPVKMTYSPPGRVWVTLLESISITGCLSKSGERETFVMTGGDGKPYLLRSNTLILTDHLGQTVTLTGGVRGIDGDEDFNREQRESGARPVMVTSLKVIGANCL